MSNSSVVIPAYNSETSLGFAIESALGQTVSPHEVIVVDDGSTDGTADVARKYGDKVVFLQQENAGQGAARNKGMQYATGTYIALLDADDYWKDGFLERMEGFLNTTPEAVAASCGFLVERQKGSYAGPKQHEALKDQHPDGFVLDDFFDFWAKYDHVRTGTVLFRRSVIDDIGVQNPALRISQDLEYWAMLATAGPWGLVPDILWIGTSEKVARTTGWRKKYAARRARTPTVEAWQDRIIPRLTDKQKGAFAQVRGRVAAGYAVNHVLGGNPALGRALVQSYGGSFPDQKLLKLLKLGDRWGALSWAAVCAALNFRESRK